MVGDEEGLFLLAPKGASEGTQNVEAGGSAGNYGVDMGGEGEVGVKGDPQDAGVFGQWEEGGVKGDMRMGVGLVGMGVKRVTVDFGADRESPFRSAHSDTRVAWSVRAEAAVR